MTINTTAIERSWVAAAAIARAGYRVRYVDYCEDAQTPGLLGQISAVTDHARREVKVSKVVNDTDEKMAATLAHELHHVLDPEWDCGNRDVLGRGSGLALASVRAAIEALPSADIPGYGRRRIYLDDVLALLGDKAGSNDA